mmetsp:Transcript_71534/g.155411  ORF Transcript_71534/g.155411 Transcript_71534/m.155411 type:complete len:234 (+) Transcript_71534:50-751(+)
MLASPEPFSVVCGREGSTWASPRPASRCSSRGSRPGPAVGAFRSRLAAKPPGARQADCRRRASIEASSRRPRRPRPLTVPRWPFSARQRLLPRNEDLDALPLPCRAAQYVAPFTRPPAISFPVVPNDEISGDPFANEVQRITGRRDEGAEPQPRCSSAFRMRSPSPMTCPPFRPQSAAARGLGSPWGVKSAPLPAEVLRRDVSIARKSPYGELDRPAYYHQWKPQWVLEQSYM